MTPAPISAEGRQVANAAWMNGLAVPSHWRRARVKHLVQSMRAGNTITVDAIEATGNFPVYGANGLRGFTSRLTHTGTHVLIGRQGALCGNVHLVSGEFWASEHAIVATPARHVDERWLAALLQVMNLGQYSTSAAQPGIGVGQISPLEVYVPPLDEQRAIADYLDHETAQIDALVAKQEEFIGLLRERRRRVVSALLAKMASTTHRHDKLHRRTRMGNGSTPRSGEGRYWIDGDIPWVNSSVVNSPEVREPSRYVTRIAVEECHLPMVKPGAILVALTGQGKTRGAVTILRIKSTINQHLAFIEPDERYWLPEYLMWLMYSKYEHLRQISGENGATKGGLTVGDLRALRVALPDLDEQHRLVTELENATARIDTLIAKAEEHIVLAKERRAALITAAVTGQIDVRTARKAS